MVQSNYSRRQTKTDRIVDTIAAQIGSGLLNEGDRLPSIRRAAEEFNVSKNTVVEAYDRLVAKGQIVARPGSGFSVAPAARPPRSEAAPRHVVEAVDSVSLLRAQLDQNYAIRVGDGRPPPSWMAGLSLRLPRDLLSETEQNTSGYGSAMGHAALRQLIAARHQLDGIPLEPDQIVTTFGANHALDLIVRRYLSPGDTVLVDEPGYYPLFAKLKLAQVNYVGVPRLVTGPDLDRLKEIALRERPKIYFTQSTAHNPTGGSYDLATAHGLLTLAETCNFLVVDDDPFSDLPGARGIRLAALDRFTHVIGVGTFSKTLSASFRTGYVAARSEIVAEIAELKMLTTVNSSRFSEMIITEMIRNRTYERHLKRLSQRLDHASEALIRNLAELGLACRVPPGQGYYAWLDLPPGVSDTELAHAAAREGIFLAPSTFFSVTSETQPAGMRLNITRTDDARFFTFLRRELSQASASG